MPCCNVKYAAIIESGKIFFFGDGPRQNYLLFYFLLPGFIYSWPSYIFVDNIFNNEINIKS